MLIMINCMYIVLVREESVKNIFCFFKVRECLHELRVTMKLAVPLYTLTCEINDVLWMYTHSVNQEKGHINLKYSECNCN